MSATHRTAPHAPARRQLGVAMVEFVVGLPLLLLLLYGTCELGNLLVQFSVLADAARDADRYLASNALLGSSGVVNLSPALTTAAQNLAVYGNAAGTGTPLLPQLAPGQVTIAVDPSNNVSVSVVYPYQSLFGGTLPFFVNGGSLDTGAMTLNAYTSMAAL